MRNLLHKFMYWLFRPYIETIITERILLFYGAMIERGEIRRGTKPTTSSSGCSPR